MTKPVISICTLAFNHEHYISKAINSFLNQKTSFPVEIIIHDDASTDKTPEIIIAYAAKYPNLIFPILQKENQLSKGIRPSPTYVWPRARGKYIALCEGDDYWTDPYKLQKQVDFLESNPENGLVHTELDHYYVRGKKTVKNHWKSNGVTIQSGDIYQSLMGGHNSMIYACTACFKSSFVVDNFDYEKIINQHFIMGDAPLWRHIAIKSKIGYLNESTAVKNVLVSSATQGHGYNQNMKWNESSRNVFDYFNLIQPVSKTYADLFYCNYRKRLLQLCFNYNSDHELFLQTYSDMEKSNFEIWIMKLGIQNQQLYSLCILILKIRRRLYHSHFKLNIFSLKRHKHSTS